MALHFKIILSLMIQRYNQHLIGFEWLIQFPPPIQDYPEASVPHIHMQARMILTHEGLGDSYATIVKDNSTGFHVCMGISTNTKMFGHLLVTLLVV